MIIDISQFQGVPDFHELKRHGVTAVYIKASEGETFVSPTLREQWAKAGEAKLIRGTYHFARQDAHPGLGREAQAAALEALPHGDGYMGCKYTESATDATEATEDPGWDGIAPEDVGRAFAGARAEANHYMRTMRALPGRSGHAWHKGELRPVLDFEVGTPDHRYSPWRDAFFRAIVNGSNHSPVLYTFPFFNSWKRPPHFAEQLWIADFNGGSRPPRVPGGYHTYALHQYTSSGHVPPIHGNVDFSKLHPGRRIDHLRCKVTG